MHALIVYHSDYGNTQKMAEAIAAGMNVGQADISMQIKNAGDTHMDDLILADIIVFGTSVHMGSMAWPLKKLIDQASKLWMDGSLEGKVGGVFATGGGFGGAGGGVEQTMISLYSNFLEHGMMIVGFPKSLPGYADGGLQWGPYGRTGNHEGMPSGITDKSLVAARSYGAHLAETATGIINR